ncbi:MAG TPA: hypothetical protein P5159_05125 [Phycisphaerae bacterium]|nr:hypothetical protein [Phycisphaerae bacterium]
MFATHRIGWMVLGLAWLAIPSVWVASAGEPEERDRAVARDRQGDEKRIQQMIDRRVDQRIRELVEKFGPEVQRRVAAIRDQVLPRMIEGSRLGGGAGFARRGPMQARAGRGLGRPGQGFGRGFGPGWLGGGKAGGGGGGFRARGTFVGLR